MGRTATHGVVQAKLILPAKGGKEQDMGPHLFFVQLRSLGKFCVMYVINFQWSKIVQMTTRCYLGSR